jgi:WxcM-like protein
MYKIIELPKNLDPRGNLTFVQFPEQLPFEIKRVFWTYDVPGGESRGGHAFKKQQEFIIALSGSFDVVISLPDGKSEKIQLNRSYYGLYISPLIWRHMENFSTNALALHLASTFYDDSDYIYELEEYKNLDQR